MKRKKEPSRADIFIAVLLFDLLSVECRGACASLKATLIAEEATIQPGHPFWVAVRLEMADHWHAYWKNPGDYGMPISVDPRLPSAATAGALEWPYPQRIDVDSIVAYGYEGDVWFLTR